MTEPRPLVVGIGNPFRGDDGAGPWVAEQLSARGFRTLAHEGDGTRLIDLFSTEAAVVLVDAARSGAASGTVHRFDGMAPLPAEFFHYSTHRFGLAEAVETARALGLLPARLAVYGIEGAEFAAGTTLSPVVAAAAEALVDEIALRYPSVSA